MQARVEELLREQAQPAAIRPEVKQQLAVAQLQAELSETRSALAQVCTRICTEKILPLSRHVCFVPYSALRHPVVHVMCQLGSFSNSKHITF